MKNCTFLILLLISYLANSQIVTLDPLFASENDFITVTYDATQGSRGLLNESQVYMHAGVITNKSTSSTQWRHVIGNWGTDDSRVKMTNIGNNKHQISYNIRQFHNVPADEKVLRLAFVFRNINGSREGKTADIQDIFIDLYDENSGFQALLLTPTAPSLLVAPGQIIPVKIATSIDANIQLYQNGNLLQSSTGKSLNYDIPASTQGEYNVEYWAINNNDTLKGGFSYLITPTRIVKELPQNSLLGLNRLSDTSIRLVLQAPRKKNVYVVGDFSDYKISNSYFMNNTPDGEYWWIEINDLQPNQNYTYQYLVDGEIRIADPMSELILDSNNDNDIGPNIFPNMPPFPTGKTSGIVTVFKPKKDEFTWQYDNYERPDPTNLFIYELLMRDFLSEQSFQNLTDTLDYLGRLGVTAIELMPISEFENNDSWGYNPSFHMALDKYYGSPEAFKRLVDECHRRGIAVILDVVYNHVFGQSPLARLYWDNERRRPADDNPWLNVEAKHPYNVGYDVNHENKASRDWMDQINKYWVEEYHIDGFRFDLTKGFTQRQSTEATASNYDASRITILKRMADKIWEYDPKSTLILEHFCENREEKELADYGFMFWGNLNYNFSEASMGFHANNRSNFNWISHKQRAWQKPHVVGYMESHDEERMMYRNIQFGNSAGSYSVKNLTTALKRVEAAVPLFLLIPGPKMIWQFGELGYDFSINRCTNGSIANECRLARKPIRWDYQNDERRKNLYNVFAGMAHLKKDFPVFKSEDFSLSVAAPFKTIQIRSANHNIQIMANFDVINTTSRVTFPTAGLYYEYFTGDSLTLQSNAMNITLQPGEYRLYSDVKLTNPNLTSSTDDFSTQSKEIKVYPNPTQNQLNIELDIPKPKRYDFQLVGLDGKVFMMISDMYLDAGLNEIEIDVSQINSGLYFLNVRSDNDQRIEKVTIVR